MQQQRLELPIPESYHYGKWVRHAGVEWASSRVALWLIEGGVLWLSSDHVAGKSSFLHVLNDEHPHVGLVTPMVASMPALKQVESWLEQLKEHVCWVIDLPAGKLPSAIGFAVFHMIERAKEMNRSLLISWSCADELLSPPELGSRMRMLERVKMEPPKDDMALKAILVSVAESMQWQVKESLLNVILYHFSRDLDDQVRALKRLESASLEERTRLTQSWAKEQLQHLKQMSLGKL